MTGAAFKAENDMHPGREPRSGAVKFLRNAMEALVLILVCLSPWVYGAVHPGFEFFLLAGLAVLLALWGVRMLLERKVTWKKCPVALCLAGLYLSGLWQVTSLPDHWLRWLSPGTARLYDHLLPARAKLLPFGADRVTPVPAAGTTISLFPGSTKQQLLRLLAVFLLFAVVRNNVASIACLRR